MKAILNQNLFRINQVINTIDWSSESKANKSIREKGLPIFMNGYVIFRDNLPRCVDTSPQTEPIIGTIGFEIKEIPSIKIEKFEGIQEIEFEIEDNILIIKNILYVTEAE
jgi:hypothetical protein